MLTSFSRRVTGTILIVAVLALVAAGAAGARTSGRIIGSTTTALTGGLYYYAHANAASPHTVSAKIATKPAQKVLLQWSMTCANGASTDANYDPSTASKSGQKSVTSPATQVLPLPYKTPKSCTVTVYAKLAKKANATLTILQS
jgi:hypothetical protein